MNPKPLAKFTSKRLPERKRRMTLVAGMFCKDALLLCADTEENVGLTGKRSVKKIFEMGGTKWDMAVATAGHSALCDVAVKRIHEAVAKAPDEFLQHHELVIESILTTIHKRHIWAKHLPEKEKLEREIELLIGIQERNGQSYLYKTSEEILQPQDKYACAGIGEEIAYYFLDRIYQPDLDQDECHTLMSFIVREAKGSVGGVGLNTTMSALGKDGIRSLSFIGQDGEMTIPHLSDCLHGFWKKDGRP